MLPPETIVSPSPNLSIGIGGHLTAVHKDHGAVDIILLTGNALIVLRLDINGRNIRKLLLLMSLGENGSEHEQTL